jgi:hypothetical protein
VPTSVGTKTTVSLQLELAARVAPQPAVAAGVATRLDAADGDGGSGMVRQLDGFDFAGLADDYRSEIKAVRRKSFLCDSCSCESDDLRTERGVVGNGYAAVNRPCCRRGEVHGDRAGATGRDTRATCVRLGEHTAGYNTADGQSVYVVWIGQGYRFSRTRGVYRLIGKSQAGKRQGGVLRLGTCANQYEHQSNQDVITSAVHIPSFKVERKIATLLVPCRAACATTDASLGGLRG